MDSIGSAIASVLLTILVVVIIVVAGITWFTGRWVYKKDYIESKVRLTPNIKLTTDGVKVDTIFIYKAVTPKQ